MNSVKIVYTITGIITNTKAMFVRKNANTVELLSPSKLSSIGFFASLSLLVVSLILTS